MNSQNPSDFAARLARLSTHFAVENREEAAPRDIGPDSVNAEEVCGSRGRYWLRRMPYDPIEPWGETVVEQVCASAVDCGLRIPFSVPEPRFPLNECLFVDCETTGLSSGAGTVAFLIAVGQFDGHAFNVDQYFLPDLSNEPSILDELARRFESAAALVTYNGSSFDLPLLEGRFNFWRLDPSFRELPHLDLLWPTRVMFKHRMPSCSLSSVEQQLLRFARVEDLPGALVPEVYFEYLRNGYSPRLHAVFEHNRLDVVSLFVYALWLDVATHPRQPSLAHPDDLRALAQFWFRHRQTAPALAALDEAATRVNDSHQRAALHQLRARILKRDREFDSAHTEWEHAASTDPNDSTIAEELAKHLEHRRRDYAGALQVVERAIAALEFKRTIGERVEEHYDRLLHRQARLIKKSQIM